MQIPWQLLGPNSLLVSVSQSVDQVMCCGVCVCMCVLWGGVCVCVCAGCDQSFETSGGNSSAHSTL